MGSAGDLWHAAVVRQAVDLPLPLLVLDELGLPVSQPRRPETEYSVVAAAGGLLVVFAVAPIGLLTVGDLDSGTAVAVLVIAVPFLLPLVGVLVWAGLSRI